MAGKVRDVMTADPVILQTTATAREAAQRMRDDDIGDVLVAEGTLRGIVTDRDLTTRVLADDRDGNEVSLGDLLSSDRHDGRPDDDLRDAASMMRRNAVKRAPVVEEDDTPVGILSMGDLAIELDEDSALADVSAARPDDQA